MAHCKLEVGLVMAFPALADSPAFRPGRLKRAAPFVERSWSGGLMASEKFILDRVRQVDQASWIGGTS